MSVLGNSVTQQAFTPAVDVYSGNGSTVAFTLSRPVASVAQVQAFIENVPQSPVDAFTVNGNVITFTSAPPSGSSNIYVRYTSPITQVITPSDGTVSTSSLAAGAVTTAKIADTSVTSAKVETLMQPIGVGQTWQPFTVGTQRVPGTTYTNTTGRSIMVSGQQLNTGAGASGISGLVNGVVIASGQYSAPGASYGGGVTFIVPNAATYTMTSNGSNGTLSLWSELR